LLAAQHNLQILEFTPKQIKEIICGYGDADKKSVQKMLWLQLGREINVKDDDESDAIACGLAACFISPNLLSPKLG
jgi:crossover junction endodeoxyribonuclease RuvC